MAPNSVLAEKPNTAWRFFYKQGLIDGFGHISARTETSDQFLISPHSLGKHSTPEDFVIVDLDGNQIASDAPLPGELPIHLETYGHRREWPRSPSRPGGPGPRPAPRRRERRKAC